MIAFKYLLHAQVAIVFLLLESSISLGQPTAPPEPSPEPSEPSDPQPPIELANTTRASGDGLISAFLAMGYAYSNNGLGIGARYQKVIAPVGVIKQGPNHDEVAIEAGLDYYRYSFSYNIGAGPYNITYNEVAITVGAAWNFWLLNETLALYPKIDLSYRTGSFSNDAGSMSGYGGIWVQGTGGIMYRTSGVALRAELGSGSLRLGAGMSFF
ncbi:MAG: hypothetical protein R3B48_03315 [Kofleriaceae bacterium]